MPAQINGQAEKQNQLEFYFKRIIFLVEVNLPDLIL